MDREELIKRYNAGERDFTKVNFFGVDLFEVDLSFATFLTSPVKEIKQQPFISKGYPMCFPTHIPSLEDYGFSKLQIRCLSILHKFEEREKTTEFISFSVRFGGYSYINQSIVRALKKLQKEGMVISEVAFRSANKLGGSQEDQEEPQIPTLLWKLTPEGKKLANSVF